MYPRGSWTRTGKPASDAGALHRTTELEGHFLHAHPAVHPRPRHRSAAARPRASSFAGSVALAQRAEERGYRRVWYAEHHNMPSIASSATSVLIAHVAAHTSTIRLGAGGVMLPNHSPLTIAEQFGTLDDAAPGPDRPRPRPGAGQRPEHDARAAPRPDVGRPLPAGRARAAGLPRPARPASRASTRSPGKGTDVPLYILGSSLFGAKLAAALGLPYAFASHFAPARAARRPWPPTAASSSPRRSSTGPYVIAGRQRHRRRHRRAQAQEQLAVVAAGPARSPCSAAARPLTDEEADQLLAQGASAARRPDAHLHRGRHARRGRRLPGRLRASTPTPTS